MGISQTFGLLAGLTAIVTYAAYFRQTVKGRSTPNPATWLIWLLVGIINAFTYFTVVGGNIYQSLIVIVVTSCVCIVFIYSLFKGKLTRITRVEFTVLVLALLLGVFWQITKNDRLANLLLQLIYIFSYIPTMNGLLRGTGKEDPTAWFLASTAYLFAAIAVIADFQGDWLALFYPVVSGVLGNGTVAFIALARRPK